MGKIIEVIDIKKQKEKDCLISQLIETLNIIKEKYGDIEIIHTDSEYACEIVQIGITRYDDGKYVANISYFG